ncbi:DEAD/DEAH box helicase [Lysinibacillus sp.]|uniref:DEAD/DEAH box helicase n=1 Tax=Lysinibacillus sp. TaxID=1869345 RepID=UPI0028A2DBB3|nr:DEAD/DEAH box helicase [Lysinibacillus sp.]
MTKFIPHAYQKVAIEKIIENPAYALLLDMGLGKTVSTLTAVDELKNDYFDVEKVLVIAPKRVAEDTWSREVAKWEHLRHLKISKVLGTEQQRRKALQKQADIYVINRENVEWLVSYYENGKTWPFDMIVIDELSSFKNPSSKRFRALRKVRTRTKRVVGLTGTPAPNSLIDLWSQIYLIDMGERLEKTFTKYKSKYFKQDPYRVYHIELQEGAEQQIYSKIDDICLSMKAKDYLKDLHEPVMNIVELKLSPKERELYDKLEKDSLLEFSDGDIVATTAAVLSNKLLQLSSGAAYNDKDGVQIIHSVKLDALEEIVEASQGKPILVFYNYKHDVERIKKKFKQARELDDSSTIEKWNNGEIEILLAHPASAGHGLNMQDGGHTIVWYGLNWSLELYMQANARLHRQGQKETVVVHHLVLKDSIDERVMSVLQGKEQQQEALMEAVKARMSEVLGID